MKPNKRQVIEIAGVLAVIASLLFVGMQLYLDTQVALGTLYQSRAESRLESLRSQYGNEAYFEDYSRSFQDGWRPGWWNDEIDDLFNRSKSSPDPLSVGFFLRRGVEHQMFVIGMDNNYYQYKNGLLEDEVWNNYRNTIKRTIERDPIIRSVYSTATTIHPDMQELVVELIGEIESEK